MEREIITSKANSLLSRVRKLNSRRAFRRAEGAFAAEGPKLLGEALRWGVEVEAVICAPGVPLLELPAQVRVAEVGDALLASIADTQSPQGIVFICKGKNLALPDPLGGSRYLLLDGVQDPGNVGTIWRTADAFGAEGLILCNGCADPWNPKTVRATMGAVFRLPAYECTLAAAAGRLERAGISLYVPLLGEHGQGDCGHPDGADIVRHLVPAVSRGVGHRVLLHLVAAQGLDHEGCAEQAPGFRRAQDGEAS